MLFQRLRIEEEEESKRRAEKEEQLQQANRPQRFMVGAPAQVPPVVPQAVQPLGVPASSNVDNLDSKTDEIRATAPSATPTGPSGRSGVFC